MPTSSSFIPSSAIQKSIKRKWTREQLLKNLQILGTLPPPLPPTLPPSPPASRAASPILGSKRKSSNSIPDTEQSKRPRLAPPPSDRPTNTSSQLPYHPPPPSHHFRPPNPVPSLRPEPSEDGEVTEDIAPPPPPPSRPLPSPLTTFVPIRRPRRGKPPTARFDQIHEKYHNFGRLLKYSGDARFWSTYPATNKEYKALPNPPPPNSPYHNYGGLIARLELIDALVSFTYAIWCRDYSRGQCQRDTWATIESFLNWCRHKWQPEQTVGDREKAFIGLIWMIESFIHARMFTHATAKHIDIEVDKLFTQCKNLATAATAAAAAAEEIPSTGPSTTSSSHATPPMLPSPSSLAPTSANSTPISRTNGTPNTTSNTSVSGSTNHVQSSPLPNNLRPTSTFGTAFSIAAAAGVTVPIAPSLVQSLKDQSRGIVYAKVCMEFSQRTMTLPIMARHFPATFARMVHSTLLPNEEHEPDIEDEEGELFWPAGCVTGEGLGWVCLMGKAMINEFGKEYGYRGLDGVVPKPKPEQSPGTPSEQPGQTQPAAGPAPIPTSAGCVD